jgi:hypothetical protein
MQKQKTKKVGQITLSSINSNDNTYVTLCNYNQYL